MKATVKKDIEHCLSVLQTIYPDHPMHSAFSQDPWRMLVAVVLSQRATDEATIKVCQLLFAEFPTPYLTSTAELDQLEQVLRPIGFFRQKAKAIKKLAQQVLERHNGVVPTTESELLSLPQVGRKTANIILTLYSNTPQLAVDVHVHRISNRVGWVSSTTPEQTEQLLTPFLDKTQLKTANQVLVQHGQQICRPVSPKCSLCPISEYCKRVGVTSSK